MTINEYPRLCGGTFFTLVLQDLQQRVKAREHYKGERDGLSDPEVLIGLLKVVNPDYQEPAQGALKSKTNEYKSCKTSTGAYLPFGIAATMEAFDTRVRVEYLTARNAMENFVNRFLEVGASDKRDVRLVKALIELIQKDQSIDENEDFYIGEQGEKIKKAALGDLRDVCYPAFLLGVWHYAVINRSDNTVGKDTYNAWCPSNGRGPREYKGRMGAVIDYDINVYLAGRTVMVDEPDIVADDEKCKSNENGYETPPPESKPMYGSQPLFIQQNGDGNTVIPNYGTMTINFGKH